MHNTKFIAHVAFWIGCGIFAAYTTVLQFVRYYENADTPKISFKKLHHSMEDDVYPDVTICFYSTVEADKIIRGKVYNDLYLQKNHALNKHQYNDLLIGNQKAWNEIPNATRVADVDFDEASLYKINSMFYRVVLEEGQSNITRKEVMKKSFQIPGVICFTRNFGSHLKGELVVSEYFVMKLNPQPVFAMAFVHYPGQALRSIFRRDRYLRRAFQVAGTEALKKNSIFQVKLGQMSVLKRRPDAVAPCDPSPTDDNRFWKAIFDRIPCLPSYWKTFYPQNSILKDCKNYTQFSDLNELTWGVPRNPQQLIETKRIISSISPPCNEMEITITSEVRTTSRKPMNHYDAELEIFYNMQKYQEIKNVRDFGMDGAWSSIGGYVGLFIGCSLLSLLDDGFDVLTSWRKGNPKKPSKLFFK